MDDKTLQDEVQRELEWEPQVDAAHIGVAVRSGSVTLTGHVASYAEKLAAVRAAERVHGVKAIADEITVKLPGSSVRDDSDIAEAIAREVRWNTLIPDTVEAEVKGGVVILRGEVEWSFQRREAERVVRNLTGVVGVSNLITLTTMAKPEDVEERIEQAIKRSAALDARQISVVATPGAVHLHGHVHSLYEKRLAEMAAKSAPGVREVDNELEVIA